MRSLSSLQSAMRQWFFTQPHLWTMTEVIMIVLNNKQINAVTV